MRKAYEKRRNILNNLPSFAKQLILSGRDLHAKTFRDLRIVVPRAPKSHKYAM